MKSYMRTVLDRLLVEVAGRGCIHDCNTNYTAEPKWMAHATA